MKETFHNSSVNNNIENTKTGGGVEKDDKQKDVSEQSGEESVQKQKEEARKLGLSENATEGEIKKEKDRQKKDREESDKEKIEQIRKSLQGDTESERHFEEIDLNSEEYDRRFEEEGEVYEKFAEVDAYQVEEKTPIETDVKKGDGRVVKETTNVAQKGDWVVTNPSGEQYVIKADKFPEKYEKKEDGSGKFKAKGEVTAIKSDKDVTFNAPWGEKQVVEAGGYLVDNNGERYGIDEEKFKETYQKKT